MNLTAQLVGAKVLKSQSCGRIEFDIPEQECLKDGIFGQLATMSLSQPVVTLQIDFTGDKALPTPKKEKTVWQQIREFYVKKHGLEKYELYKEDMYFQKYGKPLSSNQFSLKDVISIKEAEGILFALEREWTSNL